MTAHCVTHFIGIRYNVWMTLHYVTLGSVSHAYRYPTALMARVQCKYAPHMYICYHTCIYATAIYRLGGRAKCKSQNTTKTCTGVLKFFYRSQCYLQKRRKLWNSSAWPHHQVWSSICAAGYLRWFDAKLIFLVIEKILLPDRCVLTSRHHHQDSPARFVHLCGRKPCRANGGAPTEAPAQLQTNMNVYSFCFSSTPCIASCFTILHRIAFCCDGHWDFSVLFQCMAFFGCVC